LALKARKKIMAPYKHFTTGSRQSDFYLKWRI
jgi:hypothetical protein